MLFKARGVAAKFSVSVFLFCCVFIHAPNHQGLVQVAEFFVFDYPLSGLHFNVIRAAKAGAFSRHFFAVLKGSPYTALYKMVIGFGVGSGQMIM